MTVRRVPAAAVTVLAVSVLAAACGGGGDAGGAGAAGKAQALTVRLTDEGCDPASAQVKAGAVTFTVENGGTSKVTELEVTNEDGSILGEAENVVEGVLKPALAENGDGSLASLISRRFTDVSTALDEYRRNTPLRYALYGDLSAADRRRLAQSVDALAEPLSTVAVKVTG